MPAMRDIKSGILNESAPVDSDRIPEVTEYLPASEVFVQKAAGENHRSVQL